MDGRRPPREPTRILVRGLGALVVVAVASMLLAGWGTSAPSEEQIKAAWRDWHEDTYGPDDRPDHQDIIGTRTIVDWPNCVLVNAFDIGGRWMTLVMRDGGVVDVLPDHDAGRWEVADEHGCT